MQLQQQDTGHTDANAVKVFINENTSLQQVEPIITESDNCKAFETTSTETCITESELPSEQQQDIHVGHTDATAFKVFIITESDNCKSFETTSTETCIRELKLPSEQQHYIGHTDATAVKVIINENTSLQQVEPIITESDNCKTFETTSTETCITESELPSEQQQDIGHTNATAVKVNENTSLQQVEPIITESDNCKAFETTSTETCITELKLPSEQQHYIGHTDATAVKVFINENTSIQRVEPIITESDKCKELETASTETCITESELPSEQQQDIGHTDATAFKVFTNENTSLQQVEPIITESDNCKAFETTSTETCITELKLPSERIKLIKVLMNANVLNLADYDCQVTCDEQTGKIILTGHRRNEVEILVRKKLDTMVSAVVPVASRFLQTTKGVNWLTAEFRKRDLLSVCYIKNKASVVVAKDEECLRETITVMSNILYSETVFFGNHCLQKSDLDQFMMALNDDYMVLAETDFDMRKITVEGSATDVKLIVKSIVTESIEDSECSRNVPLSEIAGALLNKFQSEIRNFVDKEMSLQQNVKLVFNPLSLEIVGSNRDAEAAEKIITEQYIKTIQGHIVNVDDIGGNIEDFCRKDSYETFILQQLEEKYRCVIRVEDSAKLDVKAEETLRPASNITVVKGDITQFTDADVLVNPIEAETSDLTNASLMFTKAGRQALQQGFDKVCAPIWIGSDVTVTGPAGTIHSKKIFHAAIRRYRNKKSIEMFTRMISTCLRKAEDENMTSIAFPTTVGCGKLYYKPHDVANCFVEAAEGSKLQIYIVEFTEELYDEFRGYFTASDEPGVNNLATTVKADANILENPQYILHIFALDESTFAKVKEQLNLLKCRDRPQPPAHEVITEVLIEMSVVHPAIATLADEIIRRIQYLQTNELQVTIDAAQSTVTLTGKRKQDIGEVKQRILKLITEDELQQRNLSYIKKTRSREDYLISLSSTQHLGFPQYWTNYGVKNLSQAVETRQPLIRGSWLYNAVESIVRETWIKGLVRHGRDARNLKHSSIEVVNIWVNENPHHYTNYQFKLKSLAVKAAYQPFKSIIELPGVPEIRTKGLEGSVNDLNDQLISELNEVYLLHGTIHVEEILKNGIDSRFSGEKVMFGRGAYFAESSTKADQYADPKNQRTDAGHPLFMFLARVLLGEPFLCQEARPDLKKPPCSTLGCKRDNCTKHTMCDSVIGTHRDAVTPLIFREFIVYHPDQCYPEFLVQYKRK